jgi:hypothetical protein
MRIARHAAKLVPGQVKEQYKSRQGRLIIRRAEPPPMGTRKFWVGKCSMATWSEAGKIRARPTCAPSPLHQERIRLNWKRISSGLSQSDQKKSKKAVTLVML